LPPDIFSTQRARRIAVAVALGGGLALGVAGLAHAADPSPAPSTAAPSAGPSDPGADAGAPHRHKPHLDGTVKSITDTRIMITDRDGFTRQINTKSKPEGVAVGTRIHAEGAVNADGVSLDATSVVVAPEHAGKPGGGPGHRGGDRPSGPRGGGPAPGEGVPSAPAPGEGVPSAPAPSAS
jgi:hypothetical protein